MITLSWILPLTLAVTHEKTTCIRVPGKVSRNCYSKDESIVQWWWYDDLEELYLRRLPHKNIGIILESIRIQPKRLRSESLEFLFCSKFFSAYLLLNPIYSFRRKQSHHIPDATPSYQWKKSLRTIDFVFLFTIFIHSFCRHNFHHILCIHY